MTKLCLLLTLSFSDVFLIILKQISIVKDRDKQEDSELEDDLFISSVNVKDILRFLKEREVCM